MNSKEQNAQAAYYIEVSPGIRLHITDNGNGTPVIFLHGWLINNAVFQQQHKTLAARGLRVISISLRGHGNSDRPLDGYNYDQFADDLKIVFEKLGISQATLTGFSMGGAIVLHYAARHKAAHINKLVLIGAAAPSFIKRSDYPYGISGAELGGLVQLLDHNLDLVHDQAAKTMGASAEAFSEERYDWLISIFSQTYLPAAKQSLQALSDNDLRPLLPGIRLPVAIFHGRHDQVCPFVFAEQMHQLLNGSKLLSFEHSGHALFLEETEKFHNELLQFIKGG